MTEKKEKLDTVCWMCLDEIQVPRVEYVEYFNGFPTNLCPKCEEEFLMTGGSSVEQNLLA